MGPKNSAVVNRSPPSKEMSWFEKLNLKLESFIDVDPVITSTDIVQQTSQYVETSVTSVSTNMRKLCGDFMRDVFLPPFVLDSADISETTETEDHSACRQHSSPCLSDSATTEQILQQAEAVQNPERQLLSTHRPGSEVLGSRAPGTERGPKKDRLLNAVRLSQQVQQGQQGEAASRGGGNSPNRPARSASRITKPTRTSQRQGATQAKGGQVSVGSGGKAPAGPSANVTPGSNSSVKAVQVQPPSVTPPVGSNDIVTPGPSNSMTPVQTSAASATSPAVYNDNVTPGSRSSVTPVQAPTASRSASGERAGGKSQRKQVGLLTQTQTEPQVESQPQPQPQPASQFLSQFQSRSISVTQAPYPLHTEPKVQPQIQTQEVSQIQFQSHSVEQNEQPLVDAPTLLEDGQVQRCGSGAEFGKRTAKNNGKDSVPESADLINGQDYPSEMRSLSSEATAGSVGSMAMGTTFDAQSFSSVKQDEDGSEAEMFNFKRERELNTSVPWDGKPLGQTGASCEIAQAGSCHEQRAVSIQLAGKFPKAAMEGVDRASENGDGEGVEVQSKYEAVEGRDLGIGGLKGRGQVAHKQKVAAQVQPEAATSAFGIGAFRSADRKSSPGGMVAVGWGNGPVSGEVSQNGSSILWKGSPVSRNEEGGTADAGIGREESEEEAQLMQLEAVRDENAEEDENIPEIGQDEGGSLLPSYREVNDKLLSGLRSPITVLANSLEVTSENSEDVPEAQAWWYVSADHRPKWYFERTDSSASLERGSENREGEQDWEWELL